MKGKSSNIREWRFNGAKITYLNNFANFNYRVEREIWCDAVLENEGIMETFYGPHAYSLATNFALGRDAVDKWTEGTACRVSPQCTWRIYDRGTIGVNGSWEQITQGRNL